MAIKGYSNEEKASNEGSSQNQSQKQWDENPGQRDSDPKEQQRQREREEAAKKKEENAQRPGTEKSDMKLHDYQGSYTNKGENF